MDVLRSDFKEKLGVIIQAIEEADFVSFDLELSGVQQVSGQQQQQQQTESAKRKQLDEIPPLFWRYVSASEAFLPAREVPGRYSIIQFGICTFKKVPEAEGQVYSCSGFNCYLLKEPHGGKGKRDLVFNLSAVEFLRTYNFDFSKVMSNGLSFLSEEEEEEQKEYWKKKLEGKQPNKMNLVDSDSEFIEKLRKTYEELRGSQTGESRELGGWYELGWRNRNLISQIAQEYDFISIEKKKMQGKGDIFYATRVEKVLSEYEKKLIQIDEWVGFRKVLDCLWKAKKPVIAHNCFTDFLFLVDSFIQRLSETEYLDFKEKIATRMPHVFDTKTIAAEVFQLPNTSLEAMYKTLTKDDFKPAPDWVSPRPTFNCHDGVVDGGCHDAAFDAFMTGASFAIMSAACSSETLHSVQNLISIFGCLQKSNFGGVDSNVDFSNFLLVNGFDPSLANSDIQVVIDKAAIQIKGEGQKAPLLWKWMDDTSFFFRWTGDATDGNKEKFWAEFEKHEAWKTNTPETEPSKRRKEEEE